MQISTIKCHYTPRLAKKLRVENPMSARLSDDLLMGVSDDLLMGVTGRVCWDGTYACPCPTLSLQGIPSGSVLSENVQGSTVHNGQNLETIQMFMCNRTGKIGVYSYSGLLFCIWMQKHEGASNTILREESRHKIIYCVNHFVSFHTRFQARQNSCVVVESGWCYPQQGVGIGKWRATWEGLQGT